MARFASGTAASAGLRAIVLLLLGLALGLSAGAARAQAPMPVFCNGGSQLKVQDLMPGGVQPDLVVNGPCNVDMAQNGANPTVFYYGNVNITNGGSLNFNQPTSGNPDIDFWASSIIVEANGALTAGSKGLGYGDPEARGDQWGGFLTIYLYGANQSLNPPKTGKPDDPAKFPGQGVLCKSTGAGPCGIPAAVWVNNGSSLLPGCVGNTGVTDCIPGLPKATMDYFYQYAPLYGDSKCDNSTDTKTIVYSVTGGKALCGSVSADGKVGYFGYKVLAVSYGGSLDLRGYKGSETCAPVTEPGVLCSVLTRLDTGNSWMRLKDTMDLKPKQQVLYVDGAPGNRWFLATDAKRTEKIGGKDVPVHPDQVIVTTTDYLPGHSEQLTLSTVQGSKVTFDEPAKWFHSGTRYKLSDKLGTAQTRLVAGGMDQKLITDGAETRAAVALLTRNIRIVSAGDKAGETFAQAAARTKCPDMTMGCYYFGGHTIFRQGFKQVHVQGVELVQLGQGGKIGHYPIHFHKTRLVPPGTYVEDSSVNDSNTRWYVLHSTQGVTFQRDVGWKSIGHGYYLEDGTETDNNFYSDIGIFARAAIQNKQNPRMVPGILTNPNPGGSGAFAVRTRSDSENPTVFWITNGWNNYEGNMAAGAGACGVAYWLLPMMNSDRPDVPTDKNTVAIRPSDGHMKWDYDATGHFGYAGFQTERNGIFDTRYAGDTPLGVFYKNSATAAMMSLQTTIDAPSCNGVVAANAGTSVFPTVSAVKSFAPPEDEDPLNQLGQLLDDHYYPHVFGKKGATVCPLLDPSKPPGPANYNCGQFSDGSFSGEVPDCSVITEQNCTMTVIDHFTSSFTWADGAVAAVWLRPFWYLYDNSVITDVQNGGLNFISGGDMTHASLIPGYWAVAKSSLFIGHTQPQKGEPGYQTYNAFAADIGPVNTDSKLTCDPLVLPGKVVPNYCLNSDQGVSFQLVDFFVNQSLFRIYDGPNYEDGNAFLDITKADCTVSGYNSGCIYGTERLKGIPKSVINADQSNHDCYLPNAAIAWKQPNGFFYPPAFHSRNLYFGNVDIRHFVINPLFKPTQDATIDFKQGGSYITDETRVGQDYCNFNSGINGTNPGSFSSFTGIDRQTELNDDDGTLTGLSNTVPAAIPPTPNLNQTISINEDQFFGAPVESPECASNISNPDGANNLPANACKPTQASVPPVTARTSPYDYIATVVYHPDDGVTGGNWSRDCTNPTCYGVPLYRQYLSGADGETADGSGSTREWAQWYKSGCGTKAAPSANQPNCRWPFIRMAGMDRAVRETLTLNNATYYLDTAVPQAMQQGEQFNTQGLGGGSITRSFNVFLPGETYNVFFVYAKQSSKQTYQIYVGKGRDPAKVVASIAPIQVKIPGSIDPGPYTGTDKFLFVTAADYDAASGIVSVTVDFKNVTALAPTPDHGLCQPQKFCTKGGPTGCTTTLTATDPLVIANPGLLAQAKTVCGHWAIKDLDCPHDGCLGFSFALPNDGSFSADASIMNPTPHRPRPTSFPATNTNPDGSAQGQPNWLTKFLRTQRVPDSASGGQCYYPQLPGTDCAVP